MKKHNYISVVSMGIMFTLLMPFSGSAQDAVVAEPEVDPDMVFTDVYKGHPEYVALKYLKEEGILNGYQDGSFHPDALINRVEALKIILEANKKITEEFLDANSLGGADFVANKDLVTFTDVYKSRWYYPYLLKGIMDGYVKGYEDGTFKAENAVNRVESLKLLMESDNMILPVVTEQPFADVAVDEWFAPYIQEGKNRNILYFTMQNNVNPGRELTRSRFAELVYRYLKNKRDGSMYGKGSYYSDSLEGRGTSSGEPYRAAELTAAHRTLPFNTIVEVTNLENGEKVNVRINDRGPYITGRVIDLSRAAFETIAHPGQGIIYVEYKIINEETNG